MLQIYLYFSRFMNLTGFYVAATSVWEQQHQGCRYFETKLSAILILPFSFRPSFYSGCCQIHPGSRASPGLDAVAVFHPHPPDHHRDTGTPPHPEGKGHDNLLNAILYLVPWLTLIHTERNRDSSLDCACHVFEFTLVLD